MNIIQRIKVTFSSMLKGLVSWYTEAMLKAKPFLKKQIPVAIQVVENMKSFFDSPAVPILTALIPGEVDNLVADKIKTALPIIIMNLKIGGECANLSTNDEIIQCALKYLASTTKDDRKSKLLSVAALLSQHLSDGKLTWAESITAIQTYFSKNVDTQ